MAGRPESACPRGCRATLFARVVRWPPPCALRQALGSLRAGVAPAPGARCSPRPSAPCAAWSGGPRRSLLALPARPSRRLMRSSPAASPCFPRPRLLRRTGWLHVPGRGWRPSRPGPALESSFFCLRLDLN